MIYLLNNLCKVVKGNDLFKEFWAKTNYYKMYVTKYVLLS